MLEILSHLEWRKEKYTIKDLTFLGEISNSPLLTQKLLNRQELEIELNIIYLSTKAYSTIDSNSPPRISNQNAPTLQILQKQY